MIEDKSLDKWKSESAFRFHSKIPSENILQYLSSCSESSTDVTIYCSDGTVAAHKLVLASLSKMLFKVFKCQDHEEDTSVMLPDFTVAHVSSYFVGILTEFDVSEQPQYLTISNVLGIIPVLNPSPKDIAVKDEMNDKYDGDAYCSNHLDEEDQYSSDSGSELDDERGIVKEAILKVELKIDEKSEDKSISQSSQIWKYFAKDPNDPTDSQTRVSCSICNLSLSRKNFHVLAGHLKTQHQITIQKVKIGKSPQMSSPKKTSETWKYFTEDPSDSSKRLCNICEVSFCSKTNVLAGHLSTKHQIFIQMQKKQKKGSDSGRTGPAWEYLEDCSSDPSKALCKLCGKVMFRSNAVRHLSVKHNILRPQFPCTFCGKSFRDSYQRNVHEAQRHTKAYRFHCDECGKGFVEKHSLTTHKKTVHTEGCAYQCNECGKFFKLKTSLNLHIKKHDPNSKINLKKLNKAPKPVPEYSEAEILSKPHLCTVCKKRFAKEEWLKVHMRTHTGETPYHCNECPKKFISSEYLRVHMRIHTGETFACPNCDYKATTKNSLQLHIKAIHEGVTYQCPNCDYKATQKGSLQRHIKQIHQSNMAFGEMHTTL